MTYIENTYSCIDDELFMTYRPNILFLLRMGAKAIRNHNVVKISIVLGQFHT